MEFEFKKLNKLRENRIKQINRIKNDYNDKVPVICERDPKSNRPDLGKTKYIMNLNLTVRQFSSIIRKSLKIDDTVPLYFIVNGKDFISEDFHFSEIYDKYKDYQDEFLYIAYSDNSKWL